MPILPTATCSTLLGLYAEGIYLSAEFEGGSVMRYEFPDACLPGELVSLDEATGSWRLELGDERQEWTTEELLDAAPVGEIEFHLGLYNRYHFEYNDHQLDATEWLSTVRARKVYAPTLAAAFTEFHRAQPGATNVSPTSLQLVRGGRVLVRLVAA